jgi:hypothetical protein
MRRHSNTPPPRRPGQGESFGAIFGGSSKAGTDPGAAVPRPTIPPRYLVGSDVLQDVLGHTPSCIALSRQGAVSSCDCRIRPIEDPAVVISMVIQYVRLGGYGKRPLPSILVELLTRQLEFGDPACRVVTAWLVDLGMLDARILRRGAAR